MLTRECVLFENGTKKLGGITASGYVYAMPFPFHEIKTQRVVVSGSSYQVPQGLLEAAMIWINEIIKRDQSINLSEEYVLAKHFAAGTGLEKGDLLEKVFIEYIPKNDPDGLRLCEYDQNSGQIKITKRILSTGRYSKYKVVYGTENGTTPIWLAILSSLAEFPSNVNEKFNGLAAAIAAYDAGMLDAEAIYNEAVAEFVASISEVLMNPTPSEVPLAFSKLDNDKIPEKGAMPGIKTQDAEKGKSGPQPGKMLVGTCEYYHRGQMATTNRADGGIIIEPERYTALRDFMKRKEYTEAEKMTILPPDKDYVEDETDLYILESCERTWRKDPSRQDKNIFLAGEPGIGKSAKTRHFAARLGMPYRTHIFSAETSVDELFEMIIPRIDDNEESFASLSGDEQEIFKVLVSGDEINYDRIAEIMKIPTLDEIYFDPETAFESLTGDFKEGVTEYEARAEFDKKISAKVQSVYRKAKDNVGSGQMRFKRVLTPITEAVKNGYVLELQEVSTVLRPGVLTKLHDVLERASAGVLNLGCGDIYRHPDFICFVTTNVDDVGCQDIATPFLDRFPIKMKLPRLSRDMMIARVMAYTGTQDFNLAAEIVDVFTVANSTGEVYGAERRAAPRSLLSFADAVVDNCNAMREFESRILNEITFDDEIAEQIRDAVEDCDLFKNH